MSAVLRLVDNTGGGELPPLQAWELFMRGAGRAERTVRDGVATMQRLERNAGKGCDQLAPVDVSRFLADPDLGASSREAYFGSISAFYRWWATQGGTNITARLPWPRSPKLSPRPVSGPGLS
jgi:integrase/recombinase XerD